MNRARAAEVPGNRHKDYLNGLSDCGQKQRGEPPHHNINGYSP